MTLSIKIKEKEAKRILEELAAMQMMEIINSEPKSSRKSASQEKTYTHIASEKSLAKTWDNKNEDKAWRDLND